MIKAPFRTSGILRVTQEFGNTSNNAWYRANGIMSSGHNGIDIVFGDAKETFGTECICPFQNATVVKVVFSTPNSTTGNGVTIESENINGVVYQVVFWHTDEIKAKIGQKLKYGDIVCWVGNSGLVNPPPTVDAPWNGSHVHLMLFEKTFNGIFWVYNSLNNIDGAINPRELFDFTQYERGTNSTDTLAHDIWALLPFAKLQTNIVAWFKKIGLLS